jgi:hypothetical protein
LDEYFFPDLDTGFGLARDLGLTLVPVLIDFLWFRPAQVVDGVRIYGLREAVRQPDARQRLLDGVFEPILERFAHDPLVLAWDVINEPEWATFGVGSTTPSSTIGQRRMQAFIRQVAALVHDRTDQGVTVGSANASWLPLVKGLGLDFYCAHWYENNDHLAPLETPVASFGLDGPLLLGEFPTAGSQRTPAQIYATAREAGYAGTWPWSLLATDDATSRAACEAFLTEVSGQAPPPAPPAPSAPPASTSEPAEP